MAWGIAYKPEEVSVTILYLPAHLDRLKDMVERDKTTRLSSHGLLGNEAGNGYCFYETYLWLKQRDPSRPVPIRTCRT